MAQPALPLVVVEDSDEDFDALRWALRRVGVKRPVHRCASADALFAYLARAAEWSPDAPEGSAAPPPPALILLDIDLGTDDGRTVLAALKRDPKLRGIPVVMWTSSSHPAVVARCYADGASGFAIKPSEVEQLVTTARHVMDYWFDCVVLPGPEGERPAGGA